ncbi:Regulating synaptic membrane exocytosis protein 2 [Liparis tanakae]|uniref:Regulating synaptic membrane exocytosis protein 2 n=1 Tax=Liparis tanakae TaxID=230148 RepID=A0A4Z2HFF3_9TELE|nr:Regulating synaptic membrane exocytosis protein 2 [Liparis tanakae]
MDRRKEGRQAGKKGRQPDGPLWASRRKQYDTYDSRRETVRRTTGSSETTVPPGDPRQLPHEMKRVMWVCNLCRKQQEILTKSGAWFFGSGPGQVRGVFEGGPQGKKAKLQDPSLYPPYPGASGDLTPASDRSRPHGGLLRRQTSLDNGAGPRYSAPGDASIDRLEMDVTEML